MLSGFLILLAFLLAGDTVVYLFALPLPGPVLGMGLLLGWLVWRNREIPAEVDAAASGILQYLSVLFVPAGVGVILYLERLQREWPAMVGSILFGTLLSIGVTGLLLKKLSSPREKTHD